MWSLTRTSALAAVISINIWSSVNYFQNYLTYNQRERQSKEETTEQGRIYLYFS